MASEEEEEEDQNKSHIQLSVQNRHRSHIVVVLLGDFFLFIFSSPFVRAARCGLRLQRLQLAQGSFCFARKKNSNSSGRNA